MTLKDKLPDRLKCSPLLTMESDSDIETIAESIVNLSDSDGDFFKKTEKLLLMACLGYLRDWCEPSQRTIGNLISLLDAALPKDNETHTTLDNLFYEMKSGCKRVKSEDGITTLWEPSALSRCDGLTPRDSNGIDVSEDFSLTCYEGFRHAATRETHAVSLPFWCVGFVKPCGMPFEQFAPLWLKANFTNDRIFYKPSMRLAGLLSESENSKQKGTIYGKHYRKQGNLRGIESYSPRAGRVIS